MAGFRRRRFRNRAAAGRELARYVVTTIDPQSQVVVLGLPRGGLPVARPIADALIAPLEVVVVRKLGMPGQPELAMGAIAAIGGHTEVIRNDDLLVAGGISEDAFARVLASEQANLMRRQAELRRGHHTLPLDGRLVILVDDGLATGASMIAAIAAVDRLNPSAIVVAVPVAPPETCEQVAPLVDEFICPLRPRSFRAVGEAYDDFDQVTDAELTELMINFGSAE